MKISPATEEVGEAAAEEQEAAECEDVGVDDPGEAVLVELEVLPIVGSATFTIEASRMTTNCAMQRSASAIHLLSSTRARPSCRFSFGFVVPPGCTIGTWSSGSATCV